LKALNYKEGKISFQKDCPAPEQQPKEALIRVIQSGICSTDLEITKGYMHFDGVLGHEFVGIVEQCNDSNLTGRRVAGEINIGCNHCSYCKTGNSKHCPARSVLGILNKNGSFAEYLTLPMKNLHQVPDSISDDEAVFVEPLAAAFAITDQLCVTREHEVCLLGDGRLALLIAQILHLIGCSLVVAGRHEEKLDILKKMGIQTTLSCNLFDKVYDIVVDATGSPSGLEQASGIVKPGGKIVLKTTVAKERSFDFNQLVIDEVTIIGSRCGPFDQAINALKEKSVDVKPLISKTFELKDGLEALMFAGEKGALKVILKS